MVSIELILRSLEQGADRAALDKAIEALTAVGENSLPEMAAALQSTHWRVRLAVTEALGGIGGQKAAELLTARLGDRKIRVRGRAIHGLVRLGVDHMETSLAALESPEWRTREAAAQVLGEIGDARAVEPLLPLLGDGERMVRKSAVLALGRLRDEKALAPLQRTATTDREPGVRGAAEEAVVRILARRTSKSPR